MSLRNVGTHLQRSAASRPTITPFYCSCSYSGIKRRPFLFGHVCAHHSFVWSGRTFVRVFNSEYLSLPYNILLFHAVHLLFSLIL